MKAIITYSIVYDFISTMTRESIDYDVVIVGAGPAGLSAAIRLSQLANQHQFPLKICIVEKGSEVGAHILSGAVLEPRALDELIPDWRNLDNAPIKTAVTEDAFWLLTQNHHLPLPTPPPMKNHGNYIVSLEQVCQWLAKEAQSLGVDIFPGFAASELLYAEAINENGTENYSKNNAENSDAKGCVGDRVAGIITNDAGIGKNGEKKANFQPGMELRARYTLLAEGARGSLTKILCEKYKLREGRDPQTYGLGIKELWEIDPKNHRTGTVLHTIGWPLDSKTYGGSFVYHMANNLLSIGFVVGLDYENPYLDPFEEFQRFKHHPKIRPLLEGGRRICYGARALNEGGLQSIPQLSFPGGLLIGCAAGFLNVPKIKGNHTAMKSGMLAAETIFEELESSKKALRQPKSTLCNFETKIRNSWIFEELKLARNIRPAFRAGLWPGLCYAALDTYLLRGREPWTFHNHADHLTLKPAKDCKPILYPKPDGQISFDKLSSVKLSNTNHVEDQPCHLKLADPALAISVNLAIYDSPEQRYCPAAVYEIIRDKNGQNPYLQINAPNCIHCKTCDIKDPKQNITWIPPEGGGGPNYTNM